MPIIELNKRTKEEIYSSIVLRIKLMYRNRITDSEAQAAARNLISFCQEIIDCKLKGDMKTKEYK